MKALFFAAVLFSAASAMAAKDIGPAGCGLGNQIMGGKDSQILAATLNGTGTQTFGLTSGTSGCVESDGVAKLEVYVEANRVALANDVARGNGQTLSGLTHVLGCSNEGQVQQTLHESYGDIFSKGDSAEVISNQIRKVLKSRPAGASCLRLS